MSVYSVKGKGWRYDFTRKGIRHTEAWFKTKKEAVRAEAKHREELEHPVLIVQEPTVTGFLELVNLRLDHVKAYSSGEYYKTHLHMARRWVKKWGTSVCKDITQQGIQDFLLTRNEVSAFTANKELRHLRATFNFY